MRALFIGKRDYPSYISKVWPWSEINHDSIFFGGIIACMAKFQSIFSTASHNSVAPRSKLKKIDNPFLSAIIPCNLLIAGKYLPSP
jgi:hypothetical protein